MTEGVSFYELRWLMSFCEAVESQAHDPTRDLSASFFFFFCGWYVLHLFAILIAALGDNDVCPVHRMLN